MLFGKIEAGELVGPQRVLIEVNVSGEESKGGFSPDEIRAAAGELAELEGICVQGLMTMAPRGIRMWHAAPLRGFVS